MGTENIVLQADNRSDQGKGASRRLRREGKVPAILYGARREPRVLALDHQALLHHLDDESFYSSVLTLDIEGKQQPAVLKDLQRHPAKREVLHVDLQRVVATEKIRMHVPLRFVGEKKAPGVVKGGVVTHLYNEVEVACLPADLPDHLEVDISALDMDESLHLSDIQLPGGVELTELTHADEAHDQPVVAIHKVRARLEETVEEAPEEAAPDTEEPQTGE